VAYYDALKTAWAMSSAGVGDLPTGVVGTSLFGLTTAQKIAAVNGWTVTGTIPVSTTFTGAQLANWINWTEFAALTAAQQQNLMLLIAGQGPYLGGSSNTGFLPVGMLLSYFTNHSGPTIVAMTAYVNSLVFPWWQTPVAQGGGGLNGVVSLADTMTAGLS